MIDIFVINLKKRPDRLKNFKEDFDKYFNINVIEAVENNEGWKGCKESHLKCIKYAKDNNMKYIIVFEDDTIPMYEDSFEKFKNIKEEIFDKKDDWDIFIGGSSKTLKKNKIQKYNSEHKLYNIEATRSTFSIVYNNTCFDYFLNNNSEHAIDVIWYNNVKAIMPIPFLFTCYDDWSNISNKILCGVKNIIKNNEKTLIKQFENEE